MFDLKNEFKLDKQLLKEMAAQVVCWWLIFLTVALALAPIALAGLLIQHIRGPQ